MKRMLVASLVAMLAVGSAHADTLRIKTRLDNLAGTSNVLVISTSPSEITSITCLKWVMLGNGSWKDHNNFTIPATDAKSPVTLAILNGAGFDGYCKEENSIVAHTDDGDFPCHLDRGAGNWTDSTKLICSPGK